MVLKMPLKEIVQEGGFAGARRAAEQHGAAEFGIRQFYRAAIQDWNGESGNVLYNGL